MMDTNSEKLNIIQRLLQIDDKFLLAAIRNLLDYGSQHEKESITKDFWEELTEEQKAKIEISRQQHREGKGIPHKEVMAEFRKKYSA